LKIIDVKFAATVLDTWKSLP